MFLEAFATMKRETAKARERAEGGWTNDAQERISRRRALWAGGSNRLNS
jgi:hypothetical protein